MSSSTPDHSVEYQSAKDKARDIAAKFAANPKPDAAALIGGDRADDSPTSFAPESTACRTEPATADMAPSASMENRLKRGHEHTQDQYYDVPNSPQPPAKRHSYTHGGDSTAPRGHQNYDDYHRANYSEQTQLTIPSNYAGIVIGKGGESLKRLERDYHVKIQVDQEPNPETNEKTITIYGNRLDDVDFAKRMIEAKVSDYNDKIRRDQTDGNGVTNAGGASGSNGDASFQLTMKIPQSKAGFLIGRGGDRIRDIQVRTGAKLLLAAEPPAGSSEGASPNDQDVHGAVSNERVLTITGQETQVNEAKEIVEQVLATDRDTAMTGEHPEDSYKEVIPVPQSAVGMIIGRAGENIKNIKRRTMCMITLDQVADPSYNATREMTISGSEENVAFAKTLINEKIAEASQYRGRRRQNPGWRQRDQYGGGSEYYGGDNYNSNAYYYNSYGNNGGYPAMDPQYAAYYAQYGQMYPQYAGYYQQYGQQPPPNDGNSGHYQ
ncbi:hypothetical protein H4R34_002206 [Dimargaris verticillata]|uniref:K Homology domain-containing protein n=1 Tax=Dimargaris verticillata TaxID=2761393 RepID=A0A9W8B478_9FUNG|nr:hypothetical protein H4R34_002206 [Dimargaris verticillata]